MNNPTETTDIEEFKGYLHDLAAVMKKVPGRTDWKYRGFEELVLECGRVMEPKPLPKNMKQGQPRVCYANCQRLVLKNRSLTYVEGYAMAAGCLSRCNTLGCSMLTDTLSTRLGNIPAVAIWGFPWRRRGSNQFGILESSRDALMN